MTIYEMVENWISGTEAQISYYKHLDKMKNVKSNKSQTNTFFQFLFWLFIRQNIVKKHRFSQTDLVSYVLYHLNLKSFLILFIFFEISSYILDMHILQEMQCFLVISEVNSEFKVFWFRILLQKCHYIFRRFPTLNC